MIADYFAATDRSDQVGKSTKAVLFMVRPGTDLSAYYERRVSTFPGHPTLNELAALSPNAFLACSMTALAAQDRRPDSPRSLPQMHITGVEEAADNARLEFRIAQIEVDDEADAVLRVQLRKHGPEWRIIPEDDEFMAPIPWISEEPPPVGRRRLLSNPQMQPTNADRPQLR